MFYNYINVDLYTLETWPILNIINIFVNVVCGTWISSSLQLTYLIAIALNIVVHDAVLSFDNCKQENEFLG